MNLNTYNKFKVGILGVTGIVCQTFVTLLKDHPLFEIYAIGASSKSSHKMYKDSVRWNMNEEIPENIGKMIIQECYPINFENCDIIFSGLDSSVAGDIEMEFVMSDFPVFSNAKNYRMHDLVPLIVPLVNINDMDLINNQRNEWKIKNGFLLTNANCSTTGLSVVIKALEKCAPLKRILVTTMQSISGAGYPGVSSMDIMGNVIPHIDGEEEKIEEELAKILHYKNSNTIVSASCNRVPVINGHIETIFVEFDENDDIFKYMNDIQYLDMVVKSLEEYTVDLKKNQCNDSCLYSMPKSPIVVTDKLDRPQPRLDSMTNNGMSIVVGKIKKCNAFKYGIQLTLLVNNTILGAAGSAILNAEIAINYGYICKI